MVRIRGALIALMVVLMAAVLVACGGDDDETGEDADNGADTETSAPAAQNEESSPGEGVDATDEPEATETDATDDPGSGEVVSDPCGFMTQADVEAALGEPVQEPVVTYETTAGLPGTDAFASVGTCNYVSPTGFSSISITSWSSPGNDDAIRNMVELACTDKEELDVGDLACWYDSSHLEVQLANGGYFLDIFVTSQGDTTAILQTLAGVAVSNT